MTRTPGLEWLTDRQRRSYAAAVGYSAICAAFFAITSPYGAVSYLPPAYRFIYWLGLILTVLVVKAFMGPVVTRLGVGAGRALRMALASVAATPVIALMIIAVQAAIGRPVPAHYYPELSACVWIINIVLVTLDEFIVSRALPALPASKTDFDDAGNAGVSASSFRNLLPAAHRRSDIYAVSAEDHYVRVHTDKGECLLHMRLSDAERLLNAADGARTHRSWWVARDGVEEIQKDKGKFRLKLRSGAVAPVSRSGAKIIKGRGWFAQKPK